MAIFTKNAIFTLKLGKRHRLDTPQRPCFYRVFHDTGHPEIWLSARPFINMNWTPDFIKGLGLSQISGCPVSWDTL